MKKNKAKIFFGLLIIILIISIIVAIMQNNNDRTIKMYDSIINKEDYCFTMEEKNKDINYKLTVAKKASYKCIDVKSNEEHTTTLIKDDIAYYIMHDRQEYYLYDSKEIEADILIDDLKELDQKEYKIGHEKINGKDYYYEEFEDITEFIMWIEYDEDEEKVKTRFYFEGNNIKYIKNITQDEEELIKVELSNKVDEELFEIPKEYAELDL